MLVNIVLGAVIFGFALWTIIRHIRTSGEGKCASCAMRNGCERGITQTDHYPKDCSRKGL